MWRPADRTKVLCHLQIRPPLIDSCTSQTRKTPARRTATHRSDRARRHGPESTEDASFMFTLRLSSDSKRSPTMPTAAIATPSTTRAGTPICGSHQCADHGERQHGADEPADRAFHGLLGTHDRRQQSTAERPAAVVLKRVADGYGQNQQQRRFAAERPACGATSNPAARRVEWRKRGNRRGRQRAAFSLCGVPLVRGIRQRERRQARASCPTSTASTGMPGMPTATHASATAIAPAGFDTCTPARAAISRVLAKREQRHDEGDADKVDRSQEPQRGDDTSEQQRAADDSGHYLIARGARGVLSLCRRTRAVPRSPRLLGGTCGDLLLRVALFTTVKGQALD